MRKLTSFSIIYCATAAAVYLDPLSGDEPSVPAGGTREVNDFQPVVEAPLPKGFPTYTPVGQIEVKHYPTYRKAEASGRVAFWTLFKHITTAGISMTAPVEMTFGENSPPVGKERSMAFLYGNKEMGTPGKSGNVAVVDVPEMTVVSIGMRGERSDDVLVQAERRLRAWLEQNSRQYEQSGPVRVMGYNSPYVPRDRQFFEVQIPVRQPSGIAAN